MQSNDEKYRSLDQKPYDSDYFLMDTIIEAPIEKVWAQALKIGSWMNSHDLETLSGEAGKVGHFEKVTPRDTGNDVPLPRYHLYGLSEVIPNKLIALEVLPEKGGSYGETREWASFDNILFTDLGGGRTKVALLMVDVYQGKGDAAFHQRQKEKFDYARGLLGHYFENLARLVSSS